MRRGAQGCILSFAGQDHDLPGHAVQAIDSNGAGDPHIGSFVAEMLRAGDPLRAARYANVAAALSVTREGPATAPERAEVLAHLSSTQQSTYRPVPGPGTQDGED